MIVHVIAFNLLTPLQQLVCDARTLDGVSGVTIIDNASTYPPLLEWYESCDCKVIRRRTNRGAMGVFPAVDNRDWYVLTDCDLDISQVPKDACLRLRETLEANPEIKKTGLSLEIDDLPETELGVAIRRWESAFWSERFDRDWWRADIATTFAVHRPKSKWVGYGPSLRADRPYTARHVPWYWDPDDLTEEQQYYLSQDFIGTWWSARLKQEVTQ